MVTIARIIALGVVSGVFLVFWDEPFLLHLKIFVVYLHEVSHALAILATGGTVRNIAIKWDQSGFVDLQGGIYFIVAIAGYIGSVLWGSIMLYSSLKSKVGARAVSLLVAMVLLLFTFWPSAVPVTFSEQIPKYFSGLFWGGLLVVSGLLYPRINRIILFFMGSLTALYSVYDLNDFFSGDIMATDAGKLALYMVGESPQATTLAYAIAISISLVAFWILYRMLIIALKHENVEADDDDALDDDMPPPPTEITPEMMQWLEKLKEKQKSR